MNKITKAVIPAAGLGTRFLPATKTIPKEMLPIVDQPIILHIVEECVRAGIQDIVLITGRNKSAIEDFFDCSYEVEDTLEKSGKSDILKRIQSLKSLANIISVRQKSALGLGHAVLCAQPVVGADSFAVLLGDEIMISEEGAPTVTGQLCHLANETQLSTVAVMPVNKKDVHKYGIIDGEKINDSQFKIKSVIEKPSSDKAPSLLALPGRYVFTSEIFQEIKDTKKGVNGEIQLTDAMTRVAQKEGMIATLFQAQRYDAGDKFGFLQANIELALKHPELKDQLRTYLKELAASL